METEEICLASFRALSKSCLLMTEAAVNVAANCRDRSFCASRGELVYPASVPPVLCAVSVRNAVLIGKID